MANFHGFPVEFQIQDPGLGELIPTIPCGFLLPVEKIARKLPMFDGEFIYQLGNISAEIDLLKTVIYPDQLAQSTFSTSITEPNEIQLGPVCENISDNETA
jgi:hypothetical protein